MEYLRSQISAALRTGPSECLLREIKYQSRCVTRESRRFNKIVESIFDKQKLTETLGLSDTENTLLKLIISWKLALMVERRPLRTTRRKYGLEERTYCYMQQHENSEFSLHKAIVRHLLFNLLIFQQNNIGLTYLIPIFEKLAEEIRGQYMNASEVGYLESYKGLVKAFLKYKWLTTQDESGDKAMISHQSLESARAKYQLIGHPDLSRLVADYSNQIAQNRQNPDIVNLGDPETLSVSA